MVEDLVREDDVWLGGTAVVDVGWEFCSKCCAWPLSMSF